MIFYQSATAITVIITSSSSSSSSMLSLLRVHLTADETWRVRHHGDETPWYLTLISDLAHVLLRIVYGSEHIARIGDA